MKFINVLLLFILSFTYLLGQDMIKGTVSEKDPDGKVKPLIGVNIIWKGTSMGTTSDADGKFKLPIIKQTKQLVLSMVGYSTDTITVTSKDDLSIILTEEATELGSVNVVGQTNPTRIDYLDIANKSVMTDKELYKAACCNLSESFETNPSIDVSFTDAITGAKQIEMLGLSGIYTQTTMENLPAMRGLMSNVGLTFIPGTWVQAINVSKGIGSVANGFESITGQIDVDLSKPMGKENEKPILLNLYGDYDQRFEGNLNYRLQFSKYVSSITLLHASSRKHSFDNNNDKFMDMPELSVFNVMQRWQFHTELGWEGFFGFQIVNDEKVGGTLNHSSTPSVHSDYSYSTDNRQVSVYGKLGYVFLDTPYKSFGTQWSYTDFTNESKFGMRNYNGKEKNGYFNFIYQSAFDEERKHKFRTGFSFVYDQYNETFMNKNYNRIEKIPGAFFEYTFTPDEIFSVILGLRTDYHSYYGTMVTPRVHMRYAPQEDWVIRAVAGRGFRTSNIFTEYSSVFASNRTVNILSQENFGYGLAQEKAWNYGLNITHYFIYDYREGTISLDLYRTDFETSTIGNLDSSPQQINFYSVNNGAYSNSLQLEINFQPIERLDTRIAYRYMDVKQNINGVMQDRPFSSKNRMLINLGYSTLKEDTGDAQMIYDLTIQWFDKKRIPSTSTNPTNFQARDYSPSFALVNAQVTRSFFAGFDLYVGVENLLGFKQDNLIIDPMNPHSKYFDASLVWGPVNGAMIYSGLRYRL